MTNALATFFLSPVSLPLLGLFLAVARRFIPANTIPSSFSANSLLAGFSHIFLLAVIHFITGGFATF